MSAFLLFVGTYTTGDSKGIYSLRFDALSGKTEALELAVETPNPSFLAVHERRRCLYAVNETDTFRDQPTGSLSAFRIYRDTGKLALINSVATHGTAPCHVALDRTGNLVFVANYGTGSIASFTAAHDGYLSEAVTVHQHSGASVNHSRQAGPHCHFMHVTLDNRFVLNTDLGTDQIFAYRLDAPTGRMVFYGTSACRPGSGPRHMAFSENGECAYVVCELDATVSVMSYSDQRGTLSELEFLPVQRPPGVAEKSGAGICATRDGRYVYVTERAQNLVSFFEAEGGGGRLLLRQQLGTGGKTPRFLALDPTEGWLLVANQDSHDCKLFKRDKRNGRLALDSSIALPSPVAAAFVSLF